MIAFLNGRLLPEDEAKVSIFDRSFLHGDGVFETLRVCQGKPFRWHQHLGRLERGARYLKIRLPFAPAELERPSRELIQRNGESEAILRITLSRGVGPRGYSPSGADNPTLAMSLHPAFPVDPIQPTQWDLITSTVRILANDPLTQFKTNSKLHHVLARAEAAAAGAKEALLLNTEGEAAEAASGNLFWIENQIVHTPPLTSGALPGITRAVLMEICASLGMTVREERCPPDRLRRSTGVLITLSSLGLVEAIALDHHRLESATQIGQLHRAYQRLVQRETR